MSLLLLPFKDELQTMHFVRQLHDALERNHILTFQGRCRCCRRCRVAAGAILRERHGNSDASRLLHRGHGATLARGGSCRCASWAASVQRGGMEGCGRTVIENLAKIVTQGRDACAQVDFTWSTFGLSLPEYAPAFYTSRKVFELLFLQRQAFCTPVPERKSNGGGGGKHWALAHDLGECLQSRICFRNRI